MSPFNTKEFKDLKSTWDKKLKDSGFDDLEPREGQLKTWSTKFINLRYDKAAYEAKETYYRMAGKFLYDYNFANTREKKIWELHAQAVSIRHIIKVLKSQQYAAYRDIVHATIRRLAKVMVKMYE